MQGATYQRENREIFSSAPKLFCMHKTIPNRVWIDCVVLLCMPCYISVMFHFWMYTAWKSYSCLHLKMVEGTSFQTLKTLWPRVKPTESCRQGDVHFYLGTMLVNFKHFTISSMFIISLYRQLVPVGFAQACPPSPCLLLKQEWNIFFHRLTVFLPAFIFIVPLTFCLSLHCQW